MTVNIIIAIFTSSVDIYKGIFKVSTFILQINVSIKLHKSTEQNLPPGWLIIQFDYND